MKTSCALLFTFLVWLPVNARQLSTGMSFLTYSRSATGYGLGDQGVSLNDGLSGLQYNPATLYSLSNPTLESGKFDMFLLPNTYPLSWYRAGMNVEDIGVFGLEFAYFNYGEFGITTASNPDVLSTYHGYEWALGLSYATDLGRDLAAGGTVRYARSHLSPSGGANAFLFSAGLLYHVKDWNDRLNVGFSLLDFGSPITYNDPNQPAPAPALMRFGVSVIPFETREQRLTFEFEGSRQIVDFESDGKPKSSFSALFSSLDRWPHDIVGHAGLIYEFPRLALPEGLGLSQKMIIGVLDQPYAYGWNYLMAAFETGISFEEFRLELSVSSVWNHIEPSVSPLLFLWGKTIPEESMGARLTYSPDHSWDAHESNYKRISVVGGFGIANPVGRYKDQMASNGPAFSFECAENISHESAIVATFGFQSNGNVGFLNRLDPDGHWRTWRGSMMYRFEPLRIDFPFFLQIGPTFSRVSYSSGKSITVYPQYSYNAGFTVGAGVPLEIDPILVIPSVDFVSMLLGQSIGPAPRLSGYNAWCYSIKAGVTL